MPACSKLRQKPRGAHDLKYATAISPDRTNATGRVNSPSCEQRSTNDLEPTGETAYRHDVAIDATASDAEDLLEPMHQEQPGGCDPQNA